MIGFFVFLVKVIIAVMIIGVVFDIIFKIKDK